MPTSARTGLPHGRVSSERLRGTRWQRRGLRATNVTAAAAPGVARTLIVSTAHLLLRRRSVVRQDNDLPASGAVTGG